MSLKICHLALFVVFIYWTQAAVIPENDECGPECVRILQQQMALDPKLPEHNCECTANTCHCCFEAGLPSFNITHEICLEAQYIVDKFELQVHASLNGNDLGTLSLTGKNPLPLCLSMVPLELCAQAKDISTQDTNLHMCADFFVRFSGIQLLRVPLNCFLVGTDAIQIVDQL